MPYDNWTYNTAVNGVLLSSSVIMQNAANANGNGIVLPTAGYGIAVLSIAFSMSPAWSGTVNFEAQGPDNNWYPINGRMRGGSSTPSTTITSGTGLYSLNVRGVQAIRARVSGYSAGSVTITGQAQALPSSDADEVANVSLTGSTVTIQNTITTGTNVSVAAGAYYFSARLDVTQYVAVSADVEIDVAPTTTQPTFYLEESNPWMTGNDFALTLTTKHQGSLDYMISRVARNEGNRIMFAIQNGDTVSHTFKFNVYGWRQ